MSQEMTYRGAGIDYAAMDPFKVMAQRAAQDTNFNLINRFGFSFVEGSRGESVQLINIGRGILLAHVEEGLGTKNVVADEMYRLTSKTYYDQIAEDTLAMIVNDMITLGAMPISTAMHLAVGSSDWFDDELRSHDLVDGWKRACNFAGCVWSGGETPTLKDVVMPGRAVLNGSAIGIIQPMSHLIKGDIQDGDQIILLNSTGIHANGLTLARKIADALSEGYLTQIPGGRTYGDALLDSTQIYRHVIEDALNAGISIHYAVNITGHGWRKLMRSPLLFSYVISELPEPRPIFQFIQEHGHVSDKEAYGTFNMGAGFALYVNEEDAKKVIQLLSSYDYPKRVGAIWAGHIEASDTRRVVIEPKNLVYEESSLNVR